MTTQTQQASNIRPLKIALETGAPVSGLYVEAVRPFACCALAPGAGAGMTHSFMTRVADGLAKRRINTLLYQFPFMEAGAKRPDGPAVAHAAVRGAVAAAAETSGDLPLFAGGKSFGGRMTSQAQALMPLSGVRGLVFFGFPLHPANKPASARALHLADVRVPMMFAQGTRDALADATLMRGVIAGLSAETTLYEIADGDHAMHVPKRGGRSDHEVLDDALDAVAAWMARVASAT